MVLPLIIAGARVVLGGLAEGGAVLGRGLAAGAEGAGGRAAAAGAETGEISQILGGNAEGKLTDKVMARLKQHVVEEVNRMAIEIVNDAIANTPVGKTDKNGNKIGKHMKDLWAIQLMQDPEGQAVVENSSDHAIYLENGTNKVKARHMLANAIARAKR